MTTTMPRRGVRWVAMFGAALLAAIGLTAVPAYAADPTVTMTEVPDGGGEVTVSGTGFSAEDPGIYLGVGPQGLAGFYLGANSLIEDQTVFVSPTAEVGDSAQGRTERMNADGSFSFTTTLPAEPESGLAAYTTKAHGQGFADPSQNTTTAITYAEPVPASLSATTVPAGGGEITVTGAGFSPEEPGVYLGVAPTSEGSFYDAFASGAIARDDSIWVRAAQIAADGSFTATITVPEGENGPFSVFSSRAHNLGLDDDSQDASVELTFAPAPTPTETPSASPSPTASVTPSATPSPTETPSSSPTASASPSASPTPSASPSASPTALETPSTNRPTVRASAPNSKGVITVTGSSFATADPGIYVGLGAAGHEGFYQASAADALVEGQVVAVATDYTNGSIAQGRTAQLNADGSFTLTLRLPAGASASDYTVYTSLAHGLGNRDASQDVIVELADEQDTDGQGAATPGSGTSGSGNSGSGTSSAGHTGSGTSGSGTSSAGHTGSGVTVTDSGAGVTAQAEDSGAIVQDTKPVYETVCTANAVSGATLSWGLKSSFRNYISGGVAQGSWALGSGASHQGNAFVFSGGSGSYAKDSRTGSVRFNGSVHFTGHDGALDLRLSHLRFQQNGPSSAAIIADVRSSSLEGDVVQRNGVTFATVNTSGLSVSQDRVSLNGAPATLTADGAAAFAGFYEAGTSLDPVTISLPLGEGTDCQEVLVKDGTGQYATGQTPGTAALASTGVETSGMIAAAVSLIGLGVLALAVRRRSVGQHL